MSTGEMNCNFNQEEMVQIIAMTSMFLAFLQRNEATMDHNISILEQVMRMATVLLQASGDAPYMKSVKYIWRCGTNALSQIEAQFFPDQASQTPNELIVPNQCSALSILRQQCYHSSHHLISTGQPALIEIHNWIWGRYSKTIQRDCYETMSDAYLLVEMAMDLGGIAFQA